MDRRTEHLETAAAQLAFLIGDIEHIRNALTALQGRAEAIDDAISAARSKEQ